jgi:mevalonate kinase
LLLFGEHIINKGAMGLAIPLERYDGVFQKGDMKHPEAKQSNHQLELLANYIIYSEDLRDQYDTNSFLDDVEHGLYFDSNIPKGYGLGSSAALVAAVYDRYFLYKKKNYVISEVKEQLAKLESYYHGKSSGLDAIVSYMNKAVIINQGEMVEAFVLPKEQSGKMKMFLINTHQERKTAPFVNLFLEKCKEHKFMSNLQMSLIPSNNMAIDAFLRKRYAELWKSIKIISQVQLDSMAEFIPDKFKDLWKSGLLTDQFALKICGAGGGGFIIGFAPADANLSLLLRGADFMEVLEF